MNSSKGIPNPMTDVSPEFVVLADRIIADGHTCQSVLRRLDARLAKTPAGQGRDNLLGFRRQLVERIAGGTNG